jgi:hypothetical protein
MPGWIQTDFVNFSCSKKIYRYSGDIFGKPFSGRKKCAIIVDAVLYIPVPGFL